MGRFKKGFLLGGLLGAGLIWLHTTKKGREMREQILDHASSVYEEVKHKVKSSASWEKMKKTEYLALVKDVVHRYGTEKGLADMVKEATAKLVGTQWSRIKKELKAMK